MVAFDFSGCGLSDGDYISLGYYEIEDIRAVVEHVKKMENVTFIALWGRSMGAVTAIRYCATDTDI